MNNSKAPILTEIESRDAFPQVSSNTFAVAFRPRQFLAPAGAAYYLGRGVLTINSDKITIWGKHRVDSTNLVKILYYFALAFFAASIFLAPMGMIMIGLPIFLLAWLLAQLNLRLKTKLVRKEYTLSDSQVFRFKRNKLRIQKSDCFNIVFLEKDHLPMVAQRLKSVVATDQ